MTSASWPQLLAFKLAPPPHDPGSPERILSCDEEIERRYEIVPSVACSMCCLFGIIYCFFGYRCFKAVMFLTGLMFGSVIIFLLCYKERVLDTQLSVEASVGIGLGIGTLCGLVTMLVRSVGLYMVGLLLGLLLGIASLVVMEEFHHPRTVWVPLGVLLGSGMLFAVLTLQWQRFFTTLSTAVFGSAVITVTVDYFIELFALVRYIFERIKVAPPRPVCWFTWVIMGVWPVLALLGVLIQWKVTAEGYSHTEVVLSRQQRRVQLMRIHQKEERMQKEVRKKKKRQKQQKQKQPEPLQHQQYHRPPPPTYPPPTAATTATATTTTTNKPLLPEPITYHRKPNPIRRFDGDVLSPSYIASFRDRQVDRRDYPHHSRPIARHHMADRDYDCGSQVPLTAPNGPAVRV
ncbi:transmembrane protein 198-B [Oncorhynchus keta]|uniref:transmembrane protein 198-B n=1 Tax=Oncorhynchus keta TaxID=8018 RepID=UPI00227C422D|nr:transmembrane protein 198-B [Oncorhynchus keta]